VFTCTELIKKTVVSENCTQFNPATIVVQERKLVDMPWHKIHADQETPLIAGAPTKRTPIKGNYYSSYFYVPYLLGYVVHVRCYMLR
jgi:hypothetical protein